MLSNLLDLCIERQASDLHLICGYYPTIRVNNQIIQIKTANILNEEEVNKTVFSLINPQQKEILLNNKQLDFSYQYKNYRLRINAYFTKGNLALAIRIINTQIKTVDQLNLPPIFLKFCQYNQGLVLITGPTGEGKSTTLASLINYINNTHNKHIITIEDPIEYIYPRSQSIISQRELFQDTNSWQSALKTALREDPDVILVGEMRDYESISLVLTLAETGHLVFSTLHTTSAPDAISRIIDVFPADQQLQIKTQLASVLKAVIAQRLISTINNNRYPAVEILFNNSAVAEIIRKGNFEQLDNILLTNENEGMIIFEKYLKQLIDKGIITREKALESAIRPKILAKLINL